MKPPLSHRDGGAWQADVFQVVGFILAAVGIGLYSVPLACFVAGVTMFVAGGLSRRT